MADKTSYYFDMLPVHSPPEMLESLTSYLIRLAEMNGFQTITSIAYLCFSDLPYSKVFSLRDSPTTSFEYLQSCTGYEESLLRATTFYHLGKKFGRMYNAKALQKFLSGSLNKYLHYCPICLRNCGYYSLIWRFNFLRVCATHSCQLLDACKHCGQAIPIFPAFLQIGICCWCGGDLRLCKTQSLSEEELQEAKILTQDLAFLLAPQPWETTTSRLAQYIGQQFAFLRQSKGVTIDEMARQLVIPSRNVLGVEFEYTYTYATPFQSYLKFVRYLGVSFRDIFEATQKQHISSITLLNEEVPLSEDDTIKIIKKGIQTVYHRRKIVTNRTVRQAAQLTDEELTRYPSMKIRLQQMVAAANAEYQQSTLIQPSIAIDSMRSDMGKIKNAILKLEALEMPVTCKNISSIAGIPFTSLKKDLSHVRLLNSCIASHRYEKQKILQNYESISLISVKVAIDQLKEFAESITQISIGKVVGGSLTRLMQCPQIQELLQSFPESCYEHKYQIEEDVLIRKIEEAIEYIQLSGEALTQTNICININIPVSTLYFSPKIALCIRQIMDQQKEKIITNKVVEAVSYHKINNINVSITSIGRTAHLSRDSIKKIPNIVAIIEQAKIEGH